MKTNEKYGLNKIIYIVKETCSLQYESALIEKKTDYILPIFCDIIQPVF